MTRQSLSSVLVHMPLLTTRVDLKNWGKVKACYHRHTEAHICRMGSQFYLPPETREIEAAFPEKSQPKLTFGYSIDPPQRDEMLS